jgi:hypothetical protein
MSIEAKELQAILEQNQKGTMELVKATIDEMKKPAAPTDKELAIEAQKQTERRNNADNVIKQMEAKRQMQERCTHEHSKKTGGHSHCVLVKEQDPNVRDLTGYILCQYCNARIRPDYEHLKKLDQTAIFDTNLFNRLFQDVNESGDIL